VLSGSTCPDDESSQGYRRNAIAASMKAEQAKQAFIKPNMAGQLHVL